MLPQTLALIDDDREYAEFLSQFLREQGISVDVFPDSNDLLTHDDPYRYDFYLVDLHLPGVDGVNLIKVLRRRSAVGILVVSGQLGPEVFTSVMAAGADMYLAKPVQFEQVAMAIRAVQRRAGATSAGNPGWRLDRRAQQLLAPDGARVDLSEIDLAVVECFVTANGETVSRDTLRTRLGQGANSESADSLNATIYRLRRRIEKATPTAVPLQSKSRIGYVFRAALQAV
jgi:two-component system, OmpR family, response regulator